MNTLSFKDHAELRLRFSVVICTYLFRPALSYEPRLSIPFCIRTQ